MTGQKIRPQRPGPCTVCGADLVAWHPVIGPQGHIPGCGDVSRAIGAILSPGQLEPAAPGLDPSGDGRGELSPARSATPRPSPHPRSWPRMIRSAAEIMSSIPAGG